jgi:hypothetical protein
MAEQGNKSDEQGDKIGDQGIKSADLGKRDRLDRHGGGGGLEFSRLEPRPRDRA